MKNSATLTIFFFLCTSALHAQSIQAGIALWSDYYYDFNPDTTLSGVGPNTTNIESMLLDVNNDGIEDFELKCSYTDYAQWGQILYETIEPLNNNAVAYSYTDSCTSPVDSNWLTTFPMTKDYVYGEDVLINETWFDTLIYLHYIDWNFLTTAEHMCVNNPNNNPEHYVGIKVLTATDTLFGWIRFAHIEAYSFTILDYACNSYTVGLPALTLPEKQRIKVYDLFGRETEDKSNALLIYLYSDGTTEKVFRVE